MRIEGNSVLISVKKNFEYDAYITCEGKEEDYNTFSMWSWINHLREKNWWSEDKERSFKKLANEMYGKQ